MSWPLAVYHANTQGVAFSKDVKRFDVQREKTTWCDAQMTDR